MIYHVTKDTGEGDSHIASFTTEEKAKRFRDAMVRGDTYGTWAIESEELDRFEVAEGDSLFLVDFNRDGTVIKITADDAYYMYHPQCHSWQHTPIIAVYVFAADETLAEAAARLLFDPYVKQLEETGTPF